MVYNLVYNMVYNLFLPVLLILIMKEIYYEYIKLGLNQAL